MILKDVRHRSVSDTLRMGIINFIVSGLRFTRLCLYLLFTPTLKFIKINFSTRNMNCAVKHF